MNFENAEHAYPCSKPLKIFVDSLEIISSIIPNIQKTDIEYKNTTFR